MSVWHNEMIWRCQISTSDIFHFRSGNADIIWLTYSLSCYVLLTVLRAYQDSIVASLEVAGFSCLLLGKSQSLDNFPCGWMHLDLFPFLIMPENNMDYTFKIILYSDKQTVDITFGNYIKRKNFVSIK